VGGHLLEVGLGARRQSHIGTGLSQSDGDPPPDAQAGTGDDRHPSFDPESVENHLATSWATGTIMR